MDKEFIKETKKDIENLKKIIKALDTYTHSDKEGKAMFELLDDDLEVATDILDIAIDEMSKLGTDHRDEKEDQDLTNFIYNTRENHNKNFSSLSLFGMVCTMVCKQNEMYIYDNPQSAEFTTKMQSNYLCNLEKLNEKYIELVNDYINLDEKYITVITGDNGGRLNISTYNFARVTKPYIKKTNKLLHELYDNVNNSVHLVEKMLDEIILEDIKSQGVNE